LDVVESSLVVKAEQARIAREFQALLTHATSKSDPAKRRLYERMKEANKRGR
jgi:hypothetical protein